MLYPPVLLFHPLELHEVNLFLLPHKSSQSPLKFFLSSASPVVSVLLFRSLSALSYYLSPSQNEVPRTKTQMASGRARY